MHLIFLIFVLTTLTFENENSLTQLLLRNKPTLCPNFIITYLQNAMDLLSH